MGPVASRFAAALLLTSALALSAAPPHRQPRQGGVQVETVSPDGAAARAGLAPGDTLLGWRPVGPPGVPPATAWASFDGAFAFSTFLGQVLPRGPVELRCRGASGEFVARLLWGWPGLKARPLMPGELDRLYEEGRRCGVAGAEEALRFWERAASGAQTQGLTELAVWIRLEMADLRRLRGDARGAESEGMQALELARRTGSPAANLAALETLAGARLTGRNWTGASEAAAAMTALAADTLGDPLAHAHALVVLAQANQSARLPLEARACLEEAVRICAEQCPRSPDHGAALNSLGRTCLRLGDLARAEASYAEALALFQEQALSPSETALAMEGLADTLHERGDLPGALQWFNGGLEIRRALGQELEAANDLDNLGVVLKDMGDLPAAEACTEAALRTVRELAPGGRSEAAMLNSLGVLHRLRGDLVGAERCYLQGKSLWDRIDPEGSGVANALGNLGFVARERGELDLAERRQKEGLAIVRRLSPGSLREASHLVHLGLVAYDRGDAEGAAAFYNQALEIQRSRASGSLLESYTLVDLGLLAHDAARWEEAERFYTQALEIREGLAPGGLGAAECRFHLARLKLDRGESAAGREELQRVLATQTRLAPESALTAETHFVLANLARDAGDLPEALRGLRRAVDALEAQGGNLGGGESALQRFSANYADYYRDLIEVQADLGHASDAFLSVERSRAQGLLRMLAERDLDFSRDVPETLLAEKRRLDAETESLRGRLGEMTSRSSPAEVEEVLRQLEELRGQREAAAARIQEASPALGSLQYPEPLSSEEAGRVLGPGVLLLSYSVNRTRTTLFSLADGHLRVYRIPVTRDALGTTARAFRRALGDPTTSPEVVLRQARDLYDLLLMPARKELRAAATVLVSPDGPLHGIPFQALVGRGGRYLVQEKPTALIPSATVFAEAVSRRTRHGDGGQLVAFGDPAYRATEGPAGSGLRAGPSPLPWSRTEVEGICAVYTPGAQPLLGPQASEEAAKRLGAGVSRLHLACHGLLDTRRPLESGLLLSPPQVGGDSTEDGFWQAWEIFEGLRLDADLVTLSACETALGQELGGEGLIGLTRAFHYAGARAVLSSLWSVSDDSTAALMRRFYVHLKAGAATAEALRLAQAEMASGQAQGSETAAAPTREHPFYWAGFVLTGDWR